MRSLKTEKKNGIKARSLSKIMELFNPPRHKSISRLISIAELDEELGIFHHGRSAFRYILYYDERPFILLVGRLQFSGRFMGDLLS